MFIQLVDNNNYYYCINKGHHTILHYLSLLLYIYITVLVQLHYITSLLLGNGFRLWLVGLRASVGTVPQYRGTAHHVEYGVNLWVIDPG